MGPFIRVDSKFGLFVIAEVWGATRDLGEALADKEDAGAHDTEIDSGDARILILPVSHYDESQGRNDKDVCHVANHIDGLRLY